MSLNVNQLPHFQLRLISLKAKGRSPSTRALSPIRIGYVAQILACLLAFPPSGHAQQVDSPKIPDQSVEFVPLPPSATAGITEHPLEVDMNLATEFVKLGFGPQILGQRGFQSTQFLTPPLSTHQASQLVQLIPEYGKFFKGAEVAKGIQRFAGRVWWHH